MTINIECGYRHKSSFVKSTISGAEAYEELFKVICLYDLAMVDNNKLVECSDYSGLPQKLLEDTEHQREALRSFAKEYQRAQTELSTSYEELAFWEGFFQLYGEKLGLIEEFEEQGIL